jgi:hypothetical protein
MSSAGKGGLVPQGYYTIEQWKRPAWVSVAVLPFGLSLTGAEKALERLGRPGLYRLVHTQRVVWCEREGTRVRMRKSHAGSPENLDEVREMFDRNGGRFPTDEVRATRAAAKPSRKGRSRK